MGFLLTEDGLLTGDSRLLGLNGICFFPGPDAIKLTCGYSHLFLRPEKGRRLPGVVAQTDKDFALFHPLAAPHKEFTNYGSLRGAYLEDAAAGQKSPQTGDISLYRRGSGKFIFTLKRRSEC